MNTVSSTESAGGTGGSGGSGSGVGTPAGAAAPLAPWRRSWWRPATPAQRGVDALVDAVCMAAGLMLFRAISAPSLSTWSLFEAVTFPMVVVAMAVRGWVGARRDAKQWRQLADLERASAHDLNQAEAVVRFQERPAGVAAAMLALRWAATAQVIEGRTGRVVLMVGLVCAVALAPLFSGVWLWSWVLAGAVVGLWAVLVVRRSRHLRRRVEELHEYVDAQKRRPAVSTACAEEPGLLTGSIWLAGWSAGW